MAGGIDIRVRLKNSALYLSLISIYILDMPSQQIRNVLFDFTLGIAEKPLFIFNYSADFEA